VPASSVRYYAIVKRSILKDTDFELACHSIVCLLRNFITQTQKLYFSPIQAILESEPFSITLKTVGKAKLLGEQFAKELGCSDIDCINKKVPTIANYKDGASQLLENLCLQNLTEIVKAQETVRSKIIDIYQ
jgi:hypothetical protein